MGTNVEELMTFVGEAESGTSVLPAPSEALVELRLMVEQLPEPPADLVEDKSKVRELMDIFHGVEAA